MSNSDPGYRVDDTAPNIRLYDAGATIIAEGTPDDGCLYILTSGVLGVYLKGQFIREMTGAGLMFGEMATILNTTRTATIKAQSDCKVTVFTGGLMRIIKRYPAVTMKIIVALAGRVQQLTRAQVDDKLQLPDDDSGEG